MIYLDNAATSPVDEEVLDAMLPYLREEYGTPSSKYYCKADNAKQAVEEARTKVASMFGATSEEIIFTAGSTESTNMIINQHFACPYVKSLRGFFYTSLSCLRPFAKKRPKIIWICSDMVKNIIFLCRHFCPFFF